MVRHSLNNTPGGKATGLIQLQQAGLPVPPFFVLFPEEIAGLLLAGADDAAFIQDRIERMVESQLGNEPAAARKQLAAECASLLTEPPPRSQLTLSLHSRYRQLSPADENRSVIVRSSSPFEDGAGNSGAGVFSSAADVNDFQSLIRALHRVQASAWGETALTHLAAVKNLRDAFPLPVVIQRQVRGRFHGVAFSQDPEPAGKRFLRVEWATERDGVVQGRSSGQKRIARDPEVRKGEAPPDGFSPAEREALVEKVLACETLLGGPADVEFALTGAGVVLLQARAAWRKPEADPSVTWSDLNAAEAFPGVLTPYTASFIDETLGLIIRRQLAACGFDHHLKTPLTGFIHGRVFFNLDVIRSIFRSLPVPIDVDSRLRPLLGGQELPPITPAAAPRPVNMLRFFHGSLHYLTGIWKIYREFHRFHDQALRQLNRLDFSTTPAYSSPRPVSEMDFPFSLLTEILDRQILISLAALFLHAGSAQLLESALGRPAVLLDDSATSGLEETEWLRMIQRLQSAGIPDREALPLLASRMGFLCPEGQDLAAPRLRDCPELLRVMLQQAIPLRGEIAFRPAAIRSRRLERQAAAQPLIGPWFVRSRVWLRRTLVMRERFKLLGLQGCLALKQWLEGPVWRHLGLAEPGDIHFLSREEVRRLLAGQTLPEDPHQRIRTRRRLHQAAQRRRTASLYVKGHPVFQKPAQSAGSLIIQGVAGGSGCSRGSIHHVRDAADAASFPGSGILVVPILDPLHTTLIARAAAVITGRGGLLSHGAIVCRELGIPLVLELGNQLDQLQNGQPVTVDGDSGTIILN